MRKRFGVLKSCCRISSLVVLISFLTGAAFGWSAAGSVVDGAGVALSGVLVSVKDSTAHTTTTNALGAFSLSFGSVGVLESRQTPVFAAQVVGDQLVVQAPRDEMLELSLVAASGRTLWNASVEARQGLAQAVLPAGLRAGAIFLRIRHAGGIRYQAVTYGSEGLRVAAPVAARAMAATPTLLFKKSGYRDTSFAPTSLSQTGIVVAMRLATTCAFPTSFKWKDNGAPIASAVGNGWVSIKDFTNVMYNGQHLVYASTHNGKAYGSMGMSPFTNWSEAAKAVQTKMNTSVVAPEIMYFTPKKQWILSYQWGSAKFNYMTSSDPTKANGWGGGGALLTEDVAKPDGAEYGPIDQVPICDATTCYLFYAGDNGHIYRASMPIGNFPGVFSGSKSILQDTKANLFEAVEVYTVKGTGKYLMIVECMGSARYFRAYSATSLGGTWTPIANATGENTPFAGRKNISNPPNWTNDISHGDLVREADETRTVDPCNLQLLYQGYDATFSGAYDLKPYKLGLLTLQ